MSAKTRLERLERRLANSPAGTGPGLCAGLTEQERQEKLAALLTSIGRDDAARVVRECPGDVWRDWIEDVALNSAALALPADQRCGYVLDALCERLDTSIPPLLL
jgi:hypothetical protein